MLDRWLVGPKVLLIIAGMACSCWPAQAEKRVALVIGNGAYQKVPALPNPPNDAGDVAASLQRLGFSVTKLTNAAFDDMRRGLLSFGREARGADMAVVFYAGHGMEIGGENWLIPVDAELRTDADAENEAVSLRSVMLQAAGANQLGLVILDACRNNPFAARMQRTIRVRSVDRGFARIEPTDNVLVAYSAKDGTTANDGDGRNSPFTAALLRNIETPGLEITFMFRNVRDDVMAATRREQQPFVYGSLSKEAIYLRAPAAAAGPVRSSTEPAGDEIAWRFLNRNDPAALHQFVTEFPASGHSSEAETQIAALERAAAARAADDGRRKLALIAPPVQPAAPASVQPAAVVPPVRPGSPCGRPTVGVSLASRSAQPLSSAEECALKPKDVFKECDNCPEMVVVPAGRFRMGPDGGEASWQHAVTLARPFAVGRFAVTFDEWDACVADRGCNGYRADDQGWGRGRRPVINISWNDAKAYVAWLSGKTGKAYRLPSEAEREYVTRAGTTTPYWWGSSISRDRANYDPCTECNPFSPTGQPSQGTVPVDKFAPNPFGLYQVHGNVWEWVEDCWHDSYAGAPADGSAWTVKDCSNRVMRGGAWRYIARSLLSASRDGDMYGIDYRNNDEGLRVARTLAP